MHVPDDTWHIIYIILKFCKKKLFYFYTFKGSSNFAHFRRNKEVSSSEILFINLKYLAQETLNLHDYTLNNLIKKSYKLPEGMLNA